jgi:hypothetical protein
MISSVPVKMREIIPEKRGEKGERERGREKVGEIHTFLV